MQGSKTGSPLLRISLFVATGVILASFSDLEARPAYKGVFQKKYDKKLEKKQISCLICHAKKDDGKPNTKKRNNYGQAVQKLIGKKNEKDKTKVDEALGKAAKKDSAVKNKTFGDLIEAGKVPASTE